jgi:hypothetical protein
MWGMNLDLPPSPVAHAGRAAPAEICRITARLTVASHNALLLFICIYLYFYTSNMLIDFFFFLYLCIFFIHLLYIFIQF